MVYIWSPYKTSNLRKLVSEKLLAVLAKVAYSDYFLTDVYVLSLLPHEIENNHSFITFTNAYIMQLYQPHTISLFQIFSVWLVNSDIYCYRTYWKEVEKPKDPFQYNKATCLIMLELYRLPNEFLGASLGKHALNYQQIRVDIKLTTL